MNFGNYTVRPIAERDRAFLADLIANDPYHRDTVSVGWWYANPPGEDAWAVEDEQGVVVLYFKTQTACRFSLQFVTNDKRVNWKVLTEGMQWLAQTLSGNGFREIITDSNGPELKAMAVRRLGFLPADPNTLVRPLGGENSATASQSRQDAPRQFQGAGPRPEPTDATTGQGRPLTPRVN